MFKEVEDFQNELTAKRNEGKITCYFKDIVEFENEEVKEKFLKSINYNYDEIKGKWNVVDKKMAKKIIEYILSVNIIYDTDLESKLIAAELSDYFLKQFLSNPIHYTNGRFNEDCGFFMLSQWISITNAKFDTGILVVDDNKIGIIWVEDED